MKKFLLLLCFVLFCTSCRPGPASNTDFVLNTMVTIEIFDKKQAESARIIEEAFGLCRRYENMLSKTISSSDIARANASHFADNISADTAELISNALHYSILSDGAYDITVNPLMALWGFTTPNQKKPPHEEIESTLTHVGYKNIMFDSGSIALLNNASIDLGGIAKGFIADKIKEYLTSQGVNSAIINLGGDVLTIGRKPDGSLFKIGVRKPFGENGEILAVVQADGQSVVTSGIYERYFEEDGVIYHHILNPKTGYPAENELYSVTVISESSTDGDALTTACFVMGLNDGIALLESLDNTEGIFITDDHRIFKTSGIGTKIPFEEIE